MTQFKVGDEVFVKGRVSGHTPQGQIVAYFPAIDSYIPCDSSELVPSPPAAVEQPQEMSWEDVEYTNKGTSGWCMCKHYPVEEWGVPGDSTDFDYRHARTHEPITYDHFLSLVNAAKAKAHPTAAQPQENATIYPKQYWYECQESAMAPGIADGWPKVIPAPHTPHGRLVRREYPQDVPVPTTPTNEGCPQPTATQVTQATVVFAGMERERERREFWSLCAAQCIGRQINGHEWSVGDAGFSPRVYEVATREAGKFADAMLAEFDRRGKGGE